jgi:serine/threonine protein kinase/tetratricopeptide (TPR) repeat protein
MNETRNRVRSIFLEAVELHPPERRGAYLDEACGADPELRGRVEALLEADGRADSLLDGPEPMEPGSGATTAVAPCPAPEGPGTDVGPYRLMEAIGEGGMGVVYRAEQARPVRRTVALKVIKPGMDSAQVLARFEAERQALALMDHPNIAKVLDAGTTDAGRPYFVMELIKGVPITAYCDEVRLPHRERLGLFVQVCRAVQHAHQKGIIHRDLKPSNILIAMVDGKPTPKVIDFGVAKAVDQRLTERTLFTQHGAVMGTLEYMSPEQAELSGLDVDTRSDVYALGVLLYELLTGSTPLERARLREAGYLEILRRIKEEEPPTPSTRLSESGDRIGSLAAQRRSEPTRLARQVRGELDWIVMKALDKDRTRRYETASGFARDVERHLEGDPVEAGPPSASYRLRKLAGKHRAALATVAAFAAVLLLAAAGGTYLAVRATAAERLAGRRLAEVERANAATTRALGATTRAKDEARAEAAKSRAINEFLTQDLLTQAEPSRNAAEDHVTLLEVLDRAAEKVGDRFGGQPELEEALRRTIARTYHGLASWEKAERQMRATLDSTRRRLGGDSRDTLLAQGELANILRERGRIDEALPLALQAADGLARVLGPAHPDTLVNGIYLAHAYLAAGRLAESISLHEAILERRRSRHAPDHLDILNSISNLADAYRLAGRIDAAIAMGEESVSRSTARLGPQSPDTLAARNNLAIAYLAAGRTTRAIEMFEESVSRSTARLGPDHPDTLNYRSNLASAYLTADRPAEAIAVEERTLEVRAATLGADHPATLVSRNNLASAYRNAGRTAEAIAMHEVTFKLSEAKLGADHPDTITAQNNLALAYSAAGRSAEAITMGEEVLRQKISRLGANHPETLNSRNNLASYYLWAGRTTPAIAQFEEALGLMAAKLGADHPDALNTRGNLAEAYLEDGQHDKGETLTREHVERTRAVFGPDDPRTAGALARLGRHLVRRRRFAEAEPILRASLAIRIKRLPDHWSRFGVESMLGGALLGQGRITEAETLLVAGYRGLRDRVGTMPAPASKNLAEAGERVARLYGALGRPDKADALLRPEDRPRMMPDGPDAFAR